MQILWNGWRVLEEVGDTFLVFCLTLRWLSFGIICLFFGLKIEIESVVGVVCEGTYLMYNFKRILYDP